jgi:hypothetical protein
MAETPNGKSLDIGEQAPCHGKKFSDMMAFAIPRPRLQSAIDAAWRQIFPRIADSSFAC